LQILIALINCLAGPLLIISVSFLPFLIGVHHLEVFRDLQSEVHRGQDCNLEGPWSSIQQIAIVPQSRLLCRLDRFSSRYGSKTALSIIAGELIIASSNWLIYYCGELFDRYQILQNPGSDDML
jgi:hypothetical protein